MTVGFYHVDIPGKTRPALALQMIASVRRAMPGAPIVQFTSDRAMALPGVDDVAVLPDGLPLALALVNARASVGGEWLFIDTDVIVQKDVRHVFQESGFDVAVATRDGTMRPHEIGSKFIERNLYNAGAVFSRSQRFWVDALAAAYTKEKRHAWGCDQEAMCAVIHSGRFTVTVLPNTYNYPPFTADEDVRDKAIVHLKGKRKAWASRFAA